MWTYNHTDELYHYGVLGMKWGKRRYQRKDGSLTSAGKKRLNKLTSVRDTEIARAKRFQEGEQQVLEINTNRYKNIKEEGPNSEQLKNSYGVKNDKESLREYGQTLKELFDEALSYVESDVSNSRDMVRGYIAKQDALMKMNLSDLSVTKKDIIKTADRAMKAAWNE